MFDFHDLTFKISVFSHVAAVDIVKLGKNGNFQVIDIVNQLILHRFDILVYFYLLALDSFFVI